MGEHNIDWGARFQQAAIEPCEWLPALQEMADATGSARGQLIGVGGTSAIPFNWANGFSETDTIEFLRMGGASPSINYRIAANREAAPSSIVHEPDYRRAIGRLSNDTYVDYCRDAEIPHGCQTALIAEDRALVGLAVLRTERDGLTTQAQRDEFARASAGARAAVRLQRAIEHQGIELVRNTLEAMAANCFLIDGFGHIGAMTPGAEQAVAAGQYVRIVDGSLNGTTPATIRRIGQALHTVLTDRTPTRVPLGEGRRLDMFALARRDWVLSFCPQAIVILRDTRADIAAEVDSVTQEFGLSPAEAQVAGMLIAGMEREAIAAGRGVTPETLKSQIKAIYQKTGCGREADLIALVAGLRR
ncbi:helix-turn-helix transcriptional regulator [Sphingomonas aliaeris]|uniref:Helix-turn-helix transcriptional regulator n=1 Tax=Sphingomonas aliaeris TaxID=2759526 RepID=A0A974S3B9_9SPHN|nr:LuxR C-terminal-related transcriptional regulator [Sphingomonas aliaeris]QQV76333.1 helix-turn-helix transcriptional regulator [Sphingomonas aliaeris]